MDRRFGELAPVAAQDEELTVEEQLAFQSELWGLLAKRTALYTMGESSSVPELTAKRLLDSVCFTLGLNPADLCSRDVRSLLREQVADAFERRMKDVEAKAQGVEGLWESVCLSTPLLESTALRDTLESLRNFSARYEYRYFAHEIPCDIDYPLAHPVPETMLGVDYVTEYLERLLIENAVMQCFELDRCAALLRAVHPAYRELIINLYEPIAANAIGLALAGGDVLSLRVTDEDRMRIVEKVAEKTRSQVRSMLASAACLACDALAIEDERTRKYVTDTAVDLLPRVMRLASRSGMPSGEGLSGVFLRF
ncbi:DUF6179 domain-containing protein [Raoultibacter phocaeensis]|uniref:DUF6179 domain-containing protein n=1 Tax=Raoultibacter phocaeensis TaxID=2479841 RepID=UPI0011197B17|nr:DUF6179 domain-containing protein [Raoultibacter phocaeensis]